MEGAGKLAVVTGASCGIGFEIAKLCAEHGFNLVIVSDSAAKIEAAAHRLRALGNISVDAVEAN